MNALENNEEYDQLLSQNKPILLDFYADWCGPCKTLLPVVEKLSNDYADRVEVRKVNVDKNQELAALYQIRSIPALFFIKDAKIVDRVSGVASEFELRSKLDGLLN